MNLYNYIYIYIIRVSYWFMCLDDLRCVLAIVQIFHSFGKYHRYLRNNVRSRHDI